jgi:hypothetical protein
VYVCVVCVCACLRTCWLVRASQLLWWRHGINLKLSIYKVVSTGNMSGFVEIVPDSTTIGALHATAGGASTDSTVVKHLKGVYRRPNNPFLCCSPSPSFPTASLDCRSCRSIPVVMSRACPRATVTLPFRLLASLHAARIFSAYLYFVVLPSCPSLMTGARPQN